MLKEKYILEKYPEWYEFGTSEEGKVDVANPFILTLCTVPKDQADVLIAEHNKVVRALVTALQNLHTLQGEK